MMNDCYSVPRDTLAIAALTHSGSPSTTGLRAALLNKIVADSGHVAPGTDVLSAFRFTRRLFDPAAAAAADDLAWQELWDLAGDDTYADDIDEYYGGLADRYGDR